MLSLLFFIIILIGLVYNSSLVISGASDGLMLWYTNVLPILLPFMLVSNIIVKKVNLTNASNQAKSLSAYLSTFLLGLLCGYPLGAKTTAEYVKSGIFPKTIGNILLPVCNNCSPMFISGYVIHIILGNSISFVKVILLIYLPYLILSASVYIIKKALSAFLIKKNYTHNRNTKSITPSTNSQKQISSADSDLIMTSITQITYVGVYIMICSIIIEFVIYSNFVPSCLTPIFSGATEITRGLSLISSSSLYSDTIKKALILAITSFGGISAILQTNKVIHKSGLSLVYYIFVKIICSIMTFYMTILFI